MERNGFIGFCKDSQDESPAQFGIGGRRKSPRISQNEKAWTTTLDSITVLLKERDADGIEVEFIDIPIDLEPKFLEFVASLKDNLSYRFLTKKLTLSLVIPAAPDKFPFDLKKLDESVDLFIVKGLDYHEQDGTVAAVAPLRNETPGGPSLENTMLTYLARD